MPKQKSFSFQCMTRVKLTNTDGPTVLADKSEPFDIPSQQCVNCVINMIIQDLHFGFFQTF